MSMNFLGSFARYRDYLKQSFSTFLILHLFKTVPHDVVIPPHIKLFSLPFHNYNSVTNMNHIVYIF